MDPSSPARRGTAREASGGGGCHQALRLRMPPSTSLRLVPLPVPGRIDPSTSSPTSPPSRQAWSYLDTAATSQKPQPVIDAIARGYDTTYATVHRGVYQRSADMTLAYEAARNRVARFIGGQPDECVFVRGATEDESRRATLRRPATEVRRPHPALHAGHHSNIVPWQMAAERTGAAIDVVPLTADHCIDLDAMGADAPAEHRIVALAHVFERFSASVLDAKRASEIAHSVGATILIDWMPGGAAPPRRRRRHRLRLLRLLRPQALRTDRDRRGAGAAPTCSTRCRRTRAAGSMIDRVSFEKITDAPRRPGSRQERRTSSARSDFMPRSITSPRSASTASTRTKWRWWRRRAMRLVADQLDRVLGPEDSAGIVSFAMEGVYFLHDIGTILDESRVAIRAGHHCAQPLMAALGVEATARASFGVYNGPAHADAPVAGLERVSRIFG
ncbi:aminotransferase class V-fold PLP-dependent enzyme [Sphingomonas sp. MMS24-JH45]